MTKARCVASHWRAASCRSGEPERLPGAIDRREELRPRLVVVAPVVRKPPEVGCQHRRVVGDRVLNLEGVALEGVALPVGLPVPLEVPLSSLQILRVALPAASVPRRST